MITLSEIHKLKSSKAIDRFIASRYGNNVTDFLAELDASINNILKVDLKKARRYVDGALAIFEYLPRRYKPRMLAIKGRFNHFVGNYSLALRYYSNALRLHERDKNSEAIARLGKGLMDVYKGLGRYDEALETGRRSLKYFRRKKLLTDAGQVLNNIGNIYHRMDNNRIALRYYDKARAIFLKENGFPLAIVEFNRANIYANMNQLRKAETLYNKAAALYKQTGMEISENKAKYSLAYLLFLEDRFTEAIKVFEQVYDKFTTLGDPKAAAITQLDMVELNIQLNQYGSAIMIADHIIPEFHRLGMRYEEAKAYYFASDARIKLGDYDPASRQLKKAETLFSREGNYLWLGMVNIAKSRLSMARRRYALAIRATSDARRFFKRSGDERRTIDAEITLVEAVLRSGDTARALKLAPPLLKKKLISYQGYNLNCHIGQCYYQLHDYPEALKRFKAAVAIIEKMLTGLYPDEIRFFFVIDKYDCYKKVVDCLLRLGRIHDSFVTNLRALEIINRKTDYDVRLRAQVPATLIDKRDEFRTALKKLNQSPRSEQRGAGNISSYYSIEQKLWANERKIRTRLYSEHDYRRIPEPGQYDLKKLLRKGETIVSFFSTDSIVGAFCATLSGVEFVEFDIAPDELNVSLRKLHFVFENAVFRLRDADRSRSVAESYLTSMYQKVIEPILPYISGRTVIVIADGMFAQIPFLALKDDDGHCLKDDFELRIVISPEDLRQRDKLSGQVTADRNAIFAVSSDVLPSIDVEARQINSMFRSSKLYINETANCNNLTKELKEADGFIHIAAHASRSSENPLFSRILMDDGPFFPFDLFESGVRAELVTLSGCQTAAPGLYYGNSFSLAKAFYQAGSQHVLATLWPVSDKLSMLFMISFYETLADVGNVYRAYRNAVNKIIEVTDNPAFWSSFVLLGL